MKQDFFKKKRSSSEKISWIVHDSCLMGEWREHSPLKRIAAFDFDGTLCGNLGSYVYPKHEDDWRWVHPIVPHVLASLYKSGYQIIILSNQKGILSDSKQSKKRKSIFQSRVLHILKALEFETGIEIPVRILAASTDDIYRKPRKGMWQIVREKWTDENSMLEDSFYCGDAAGRPNEWVKGFKKQDFADTDHKFALNVNMRFFVPEQIFHDNVFKGEKDQLLKLSVASLPEIPLPKHPKIHVASVNSEKKWYGLNSQELVLFVGPPAAGKTFFYRNVLSDYVHVNQDTLGNRDMCLRRATEALDRGQSVVIDNTNPDSKSRQTYIQLAKQRNIPVRCILFEIPREVCRHNNCFRRYHRSERRTPSIAASVYFSKYEEPTLDEGFQEIIRQQWCPMFESEEERSAWELFYY